MHGVRQYMVILIAGSSHTGKTLLAQRLLEKYKYPYLSIDHLKTTYGPVSYTHLCGSLSARQEEPHVQPGIKATGGAGVSGRKRKSDGDQHKIRSAG